MSPSGTATRRRHDRTVTSVTHVSASLTVFFKISLDGGLLLIVKLTVLVCIILFQELLLELGLAGFTRLADSLFFLLVDLTVLIRVKPLHEGRRRTGVLPAAATRRRHGRTVTSVTHVSAPLAVLLKISLDGGLLLIVKLTVLVCIILFQELLLELGLAGLMRLADSLFFLLIDSTILIRVELLHESSTVWIPMRSSDPARWQSSLLGRERLLLGQQRQGDNRGE